MGTSPATDVQIPVSAFSPALAGVVFPWVVVHGQSMAPTWPDGARLRVAPARVAQLRIGDCVVYHDGTQYIAHRLVARRQIEGWWWFQPKADAGETAEPWQPETALLGRVLSAEWAEQYRVLGRGRGRLRQQLRGWRARWQLAVEGLGPRFSPHRPGSPAALTDPLEDKRLTWGRYVFLRERLIACLRVLAGVGIEPMALKGTALILTGVVDAAERPMADIDLLVRPPQVAAALQALQAQGYHLRGPADAFRASLDDQIPLEDPAGAVFDLHWRLVTGGWRFRHVIQFDEAGLWRRAGEQPVAGGTVHVLGPEDQLLHLVTHLLLSGGTGLMWWQDLRCFLAHYGETLRWPMVLKLAREARVQTILWCALDTLWQRWRVPVPPAVVRALRPAWWQRAALRRLLPADVTEATHESRLQRHARELLLMDYALDRAYLLWRWSHPPRAWHQFKGAA